MFKLTKTNTIALIFAIIGALNWGLVGIFGFNLVAALFGEFSVLSRIVYTLVGICGLYLGVVLIAAAPWFHPSAHHPKPV
jgi:uncharacterized membrane protein YuzA (DUF378 family)